MAVISEVQDIAETAILHFIATSFPCQVYVLHQDLYYQSHHFWWNSIEWSRRNTETFDNVWNHLQCIENALARCVVDPKQHRGSNALLQQLHWLRIQNLINFKTAKFTFLAHSSATSSYQLISSSLSAVLLSPLSRRLPSRCSKV